MPPDWSRLDSLQRTLSQKEFIELLHNIYIPHKEYDQYLIVTDTHVDILKEYGRSEYYRYFFRDEGTDPLAKNVSGEPKHPNDFHIVIDPGHIGGNYAEMEFRHFSIDGSEAIKEGEICLQIAKKMQERLQEAGFRVSLTRDKNEPVTLLRPKDLKEDALAWFARSYGFVKTPDWEKLTGSQLKDIEKKQNILFYRTAEIRARANIIQQIKPDLVLCLHINAAPWKDNKIQATSEQHMHFLINGTYMRGELDYDDIRFDMFWRILNRYSDIEREAISHIAFSFVTEFTAPPFVYRGLRATSVNQNPYIWTRNLLANRIYEAPVLYLEPFVANNEEFVQWYRHKNKEPYPTDFEKIYVDATVNGLMNFLNNSSILSIDVK